jgi:hypothetical protein
MRILQGDALKVLRGLPANSFDGSLCDPLQKRLASHTPKPSKLNNFSYSHPFALLPRLHAKLPKNSIYLDRLDIQSIARKRTGDPGLHHVGRFSRFPVVKDALAPFAALSERIHGLSITTFVKS